MNKAIVSVESFTSYWEGGVGWSGVRVGLPCVILTRKIANDVRGAKVASFRLATAIITPQLTWHKLT